MKLLVIVGLLVLAAALAWVVWRMRAAPAGRDTSFPSPDPALTAELRRDVYALCEIGQRNIFRPGSMERAAEWIEGQLRATGYAVERHSYTLVTQSGSSDNLIVEIRGSERAGEIVVVGAHYDAVEGTVGADDNASGIAGLLALARRFRTLQSPRTLRFVAFANEEPPLFQTPDMGSWQYAKRCSERGENIVAMLSLEMLGYFDDTSGSQQYPPPLSALYPDRGNFIGFAGNIASRALVTTAIRAFRETTSFPAESAVLPELIPEIGWSDQWAFWRFGFPGLMVTDTALYRNPHYHTGGDRPERLDYESMAHVVEGLAGVLTRLADGDPQPGESLRVATRP